MAYKKGSAAAKAYMAKLRAARGKTKVGMDTTSNDFEVTSNVKNRTFTIKKNGTTYRTGKFSKTEFEEAEYNTEKDWNNFLRTQDFYSIVKVGATKKPSSTHKDTKSHNVNIRVVSGVSSLQVFWNVLMPIKGKLTKTDQIKINKFLGSKGIGTKIYPYNIADGILFTTNSKMDEYVNKIQSNNPLNKSLISYKFTDKQFSLSNPNDGDIKFGFKNYIVLTEKQKEESKFIK
jgi:hypothetical protein